MRTLTRRVHVLFAEDMYGELAARAASEGRTVGALVRSAVARDLARDAGEAALERLLAAGHRSEAGASASPLTLKQWTRHKHDSHLPGSSL
ncbi:MAG: hypothetical protein LBC97_13310 [Bifidobacteriaceae bacterium]|jgi:hypothetical protein|nr:hypothetical protein [Bifidobacteriaceae bacterium]